MEALLDPIAARPGWARALFDEDFDAPAPSDLEVIAPPAAALTQADLAAAREGGIAEGRVAASAERAVAAETLAAAADALVRELACLRDAMRAAAEENATAIARLLLDTLATLFPALCARHAQTELRAVVAALMPGLAREPEIVIRVAPALVDALAQEVARACPDDSHRVRIVADISVPLGDVRLRWQDGAAKRDAAALWKAVAEVLAPSGLLSAPIPETADVE